MTTPHLILEPRETHPSSLHGTAHALWYGVAPTPFGNAVLAWREHGVVMLHMQQPEDAAVQDMLGQHYPGSLLRHADRDAHKRLTHIFSPPAEGSSDNLCIVLSGSPFQLKVWQALLEIPFGEVRAYGELAASLGHPGAARAVGTAVAANTLAYLIPCHRVVQASGARGQYRWGAERKAQILDWEARELAQALASR